MIQRNKKGRFQQLYKNKRDCNLTIRCSKQFKRFVKNKAKEKGISQIELITNAVIKDLNKGDNMDSVIEFEIMSNKNKEIKIRGFVDVTDLDTDDALQFYDNLNQTQWRIPKNSYQEDSEAYQAYEKLKDAFETDDLFIQFIADFSTDNKETEIIERNEYILKLEK